MPPSSADTVPLFRTLCATLDTDLEAVRQQRMNWPADHDIWSLRSAWPRQMKIIAEQSAAGRTRFDLQTRVTKQNGEAGDPGFMSKTNAAQHKRRPCSRQK